MSEDKNLRMPDINRVQIAGNLTRDPELRYLATGTPICEFGIAVSRRFKDKSGETREDTIFVDVTAWSAAAEYIGTHVKKGYPVYVEGGLQMDQWEDKATGQKRTKLKVRADRVQQLSWNNANGGGYKEPKPKPREIEEPIPEDDIPF